MVNKVLSPLIWRLYRYVPPDHMLSFSHIDHGVSCYDFNPVTQAMMKTHFGENIPDYDVVMGDGKEIIGSMEFIDWLLSLERPYLVIIPMITPDDIYGMDEDVMIMYYSESYDSGSQSLWIRTDSQEVATLLAVKFSTGYTVGAGDTGCIE